MRRSTALGVLLLGCGCGSGGAADPTSGSTGTVTPTTGPAATTSTSAPSTGAAGSTTGEPGVIWQPRPGATWQWQLTGTIDTSHRVDMYDVDLFDAPDDALAALSDRIVICYFSAGTHEAWRPDADQFPDAALGSPLPDWPDERWIDHRDPTVRQIMEARLDLAVSRGCDGVEPDNVDGYENDSGLDLKPEDQLDYNRFLAAAAHARGLSVGLKNDVDQIPALVDDFDWALNEECLTYDECNRYKSFWNVGKAVFHVEYVKDWADAPARAGEVCGQFSQLSTLVKTGDLGAEFLPCE